MAMLEQVLSNVVGARQRQGRVAPNSNIRNILMLLLAAGAAKVWMDRRGQGQAQAQAQSPAGQPHPAPAQQGGGLGDILGGVLGGGSGATAGGGMGGGALGSILGAVLGGGRGGQGGGGLGGLGGLLTGAGGMGGLGSLIEQFGRNGQGQRVQSWVSTGANDSMSPADVEQALGPDTVDDLVRQSGMDRSQMLQELSETLPDAVDQLTPDGTPPPPERLQLPADRLA